MATGFHRYHRLGPGQHPGQPGELPRVAERLQVQQNHFRPIVAVPELQQVVAGDVGPVPGGDEGGQAQTAAIGLGEQGYTEGAALAEEPDPSGVVATGGGTTGASVAFIRTA